MKLLSVAKRKKIVLSVIKNALEDYKEVELNVKCIRDIYTCQEIEKIITIKLRKT